MTSVDLFLIFAGGLATITFVVAVGPPISNAIRRWLRPIPHALIIELSEQARRGEPIDKADVSTIMGQLTVADYTSLPAERQGDIQRILDAASKPPISAGGRPVEQEPLTPGSGGEVVGVRQVVSPSATRSPSATLVVENTEAPSGSAPTGIAPSEHIEGVERASAGAGQGELDALDAGRLLRQDPKRFWEQHAALIGVLSREIRQGDSLRADILGQLRDLVMRQGHAGEAEILDQGLLAIAERIVDGPSSALYDLGEAVYRLGRSHELREDFDVAVLAYSQAAAIRARYPGSQDHVDALERLATSLMAQERWEEAEAAYRDVLQIRETLGDDLGRATALHQLGILAEALGRSQEASDLHDLARSIFHSFRDPGSRT